MHLAERIQNKEFRILGITNILNSEIIIETVAGTHWRIFLNTLKTYRHQNPRGQGVFRAIWGLPNRIKNNRNK